MYLHTLVHCTVLGHMMHTNKYTINTTNLASGGADSVSLKLDELPWQWPGECTGIALAQTKHLVSMYLHTL